MGVVGCENCGVEGGAVGVMDGLMKMEVSENSVVDRVLNDDIGEGGSVGSTCTGNGRNLPRWSLFIFASVARLGQVG
jgi:hypothetical protein